MSKSSKGLANWRTNALLSVLLVLACGILMTRLGRAKLDFEIDLTEEKLSRPSSVGLELLRGLEDVLEVRAYLTGEVELGVAQIAKRRLVDQLEEVQRLARGKIKLTYRDPNGSSEARAEAVALGLVPQTVGVQQGTSAVSQDLYLGLVLRYRGREASLPFILPQSFEYAFLSTVRQLERGGEVTIGLLTGAGDGAPGDFAKLRELLGRGRRVLDLKDLDVSGQVPAAVRLLFVAGPEDLHPRAAFALDQFLQRGGHLVICVERSHVDPREATLSPIQSGLENLLETWGAPLSERVVWDTKSMNPVRTAEWIEVAGRAERGPTKMVPYPAFVHVTQAGLNVEEVVTARLPGLDLFWAQPLLPAESVEVPESIKRTTLFESSAGSYAIPPVPELVDIDPAKIRERSLALQVRSKSRVLPLGVILRGRFPTAFSAGAPEAFDPVDQALFEEAQRAAEEAGREPPTAAPVGVTEEQVLSAAAPGVVVVVGDADWVRSDFLTARNAMAVEDLADWLSQEEDLLALRARRPIQRPLTNFLSEERAALGLPAIVPGQSVATDDRARLRKEEQAVQLASRSRWLWMGLAGVGALLLAILIGVLGRLLLGTTKLEGPSAP